MPGDGILAFERLHHHRAGGHIADQIAIERPFPVHRIKGAGLGLVQMHHARGDHLQSGGFETPIDLADDVLFNAVGLDD